MIEGLKPLSEDLKVIYNGVVDKESNTQASLQVSNTQFTYYFILFEASMALITFGI